MKTLSAMAVRRRFGQVLDEVRLRGETVIVERAGRPVAKICPPDGVLPDAPTRRERKLKALQALMAIRPGRTRSPKEIDAWLRKAREDRPRP